MEQLESVKFFTLLDLHSGYWQYCIVDEDVPKTAFLTQYRLYKWLVMPMGLTNAPEIFMKMMNNLFANMLDKGVVVFLDDLLIYSTKVEEHFKLLEKVFACLCKHAFYYKLKKYSFLQKTTTFLRFNITPESLNISDT